MTKDKMKERIFEVISNHRDEIIRTGAQIQKNPELGYCEEKTSALVRKIFDKYGVEYDYPLAVTGVKGVLKGRRNDANICIIGEMDALVCPSSRLANKNGVAHACGHNAQIAAMTGAAIALSQSGVMKELDGCVTFFAVPAEEFIDLDYRRKLKNEGKIKYFGGKQQLIADGAFDGIDAAMMIHARQNDTAHRLYVRGHNLGFAEKKITFLGKSAHGSMPFDGINALNAASLALLGIHSNRETFRDEEKIRIHPIITKGGDAVNSVPDEVCIDTYIRGASAAAVQKGCAAVDRSAGGAAQIVGAEVRTENTPGYLPLAESTALSRIMEENAKMLIGGENIIYGEEITGSSDVGDLSCIIPTIQPSAGGFCAGLHSKDFDVADAEAAYIMPAKLLAACAVDLLFDGAAAAQKIKKEFVPLMTTGEYMEYLDNRKG